MHKLLFYSFICLTLNVFSQGTAVTKLDVPAIALGENQNQQVISFEALRQDKFSILYMQDLPASIVGDREFKSDKAIGAFTDKNMRSMVPHSDRVILLTRQTISANNESTTNFWVVAVRELQSDMKYTMYYPTNFVHPIIKNELEVNYSLKNLEQIKGLSTREFEALVLIGKKTYGFYEYPQPTFSSTQTNFMDDFKYLKSGFQELRAVLGKGDIPKEEKILFKREVVDKIRIAATKIDKKDSVQIKLYMASNDGANYELLNSQTFFGTTIPGFATALVYDNSLKVAGAFGYVFIKYKDAAGESRNQPLALGIDDNGDGQFWKLEAGKNTMNSFLPYFSYTDKKGIHVISRNQEKIFKPFYQHHLFKKDGTTVLLYPANETEVNSEKKEYIYTEQEKKPTSTTSTSYSTMGKEDYPAGIIEINKTKFIITGNKLVRNDGTTVTTTYGSLSVMRIDGDDKIKDMFDLQENQGTTEIYPRPLAKYADKAYYVINYPNKFKLVLSENKIEAQVLENTIYKLVYMANGDYVSNNQFGNILMTKTIVGNKYTLEFFPTGL